MPPSLISRIPEPRGAEHLATIVYGFPNCDSDEGIAMLARVYRRQTYYTLVRSRMIAFFHKVSDMHGIWNPDFRPMRASIPVLSTRFLTKHDAVFAARHHLLTVPYLLRFGPVEFRKQAAARRQKAGAV